MTAAERAERGLRKKGGHTHRRRIRRRKEAPRRNIKSPLPRGRMASYDGGANVFLCSLDGPINKYVVPSYVLRRRSPFLRYAGNEVSTT